MNSPPSRSSGEKQIFAHAADADPVRGRDSPQASFSRAQAAQEVERQPMRGSQSSQNQAQGGQPQSLRGGAGDFGKLRNDNTELRDENMAGHSKAHQAAANKYKQNRPSQRPDQHNQSHNAAGDPAEGDQQ